MALFNTAWRNLMGAAVQSALAAGATFQVWATSTVPADADTAVTGTLLADGTAPTASYNSSTRVLTLSGLSDTVINATGTPALLRIIDDGGARAQFTAKMSAASGSAEVVITDATDAAATQLLANRVFNGSITVQF